MIFGVAGPNGAGKGEIVEYLVARSFESFSLSDEIRQELSRRGIEESRERMIEVAEPKVTLGDWPEAPPAVVSSADLAATPDAPAEILEDCVADPATAPDAPSRSSR